MAATWPAVHSTIVGAALPEPYFSLLGATCGLLTVVILGYVALRLARRWTKADEKAESHTNSDFASFRQLYERGEITEEEYDRIRNRLGNKLRAEIRVPPPIRPDEEPLTDIQILDPITNVQPPPPPEGQPPPAPPAAGNLEV